MKNLAKKRNPLDIETSCPLTSARICGDPVHSDGGIYPVRQFLHAIGRSAFILDMGDEESYQQYEVLKREDGSLWELGRGGMGITYKAYDTKLRRVVALKVINHARLNSDIARQRFLREARAAASLQHQNVASIFNLGTKLGEYFYVMEFIEGETLNAYVRRRGPLEITEALNIALQVCRALEAAAKQHLVHRDLKPSNLMLVDRQGERIVKVIDFGLAKSTKGEAEDSVAISGGSTAGLVGTLDFASPEQLAEGDVDIRSDIYSLGVTLYFMLTGKPPFAGTFSQIICQHLYDPLPTEPLAHLPSCVVTLIKRMTDKDRNKRPQTPRELQHEIFACLDQLRRSVDAIQDKAPTIGLGSQSSSIEPAQQFAASVPTSSPTGSPVSEVRSITPGQVTQAVPLQSKAFVKRSHKSAPVLRFILAIAVAAIVGGAGYLVYQRSRPAAQAVPAPPSSPAAKSTLPEQEIVSARATPTGTVGTTEGATARVVRVLTGHSGPVRGVAVTPGGDRAVSASDDQTLRCWDLQTGQTAQVLRGHTGVVTDVAITPDGYHAVSASEDKTLRIWDLQTGQARVLTGHTDEINSVAMLPGGRRFVSASHDGELRIWDLETGQTVGVLGPRTHTMVFDSLAVTPDGRRAITGLSDATLRVWDLGTAQTLSVLTGHTALVDCVALTPDGRRAISGSWDFTLRVWDLKTSQALRTLKGHTGAVTDVAVIANSGRAISASYDQTLRLWDLETGQTVLICTENTSKFRSVAVTPDGRYAISGSLDGALRVWDLGAAGKPK